MADDQIFSDGYVPATDTRAEQPAQETEAVPIELQLEEDIKHNAQQYGLGKPKRETVRARIALDD